MRTNGNEPDFSVEENNELNGLTKREYFAALAMQGILSAGLTSIENTVAQAAITHADALIEALNGSRLCEAVNFEKQKRRWKTKVQN